MVGDQSPICIKKVSMEDLRHSLRSDVFHFRTCERFQVKDGFNGLEGLSSK